MALKAHEVKMKRYGVKIYQEMGKKGAETNLKKGKEYFAELGRKSAAKRKAVKEAKIKEAAEQKKPFATISKFLQGKI